ncbi:oligosaccharide flippase family protein [uncultured Pelagimonas sp.]|uniref:oligosaccharide flippase family protein n=1 Tax=uncultured Pelagimonas sp. TaxID=1618102 RepID=UPI002635BD6B|nr:oligosaccharide flippase family protein [uncultured Pelagimonas sp.]
MTGKLKHQALWSALLQFSRFGGNAVLFLVMARFLSLEEIGAFGMAYAPIRWTQVLLKTGVSDSVVVTLRKAGQGQQTRAVFDALFWLAIGFSGLIIALIAAIAFALQIVLSSEQPVSEMMWVLSAVPLAFGLAAVPEGLLRKNLQIRSLALRTLAVQLASAGLAIWLAMQGAGGWALVGFAVLNAVLSSAISIAMARYWPQHGPDVAAIRAEFRQTSTISARALVANGVYALLQFSIGLGLGLAAAGAFQIAQRVYQILDALCLAPIRFLVLPLFSREAEKRGGALSADTLRRALGLTGLISAPVYLGTIVVAGPLLQRVIGPENASQSLPALQLLCLLGLSMASVTVLTQALTVAGHAGLALRRTIWTLCATALLALPGLLYSVEAVALGFVIASYLVLAVFFTRLEPIFGLSGKTAFEAVARPYLAAALSLGLVWVTSRGLATALGWPEQAVLFGLLVPGVALYAVLAKYLAPEATQHLRSALKR